MLKGLCLPPLFSFLVWAKKTAPNGTVLLKSYKIFKSYADFFMRLAAKPNNPIPNSAIEPGSGIEGEIEPSRVVERYL